MRDLHIHIERGPYTEKWIEKFINRGIEAGMEEICLLEHSVRFKEFHPTFKEAGEYSNYQRKWLEEKKKTAHTLGEYKFLIDKIKSKDYPIKVSFGIEVCYFEQHIDEISRLCSDDIFDYVLGSVHWIDNWTFNQRKYQWLTRDVNEIYKRYFEMQNSLAESGVFDIIAHPDLITCHGLYPDYGLAQSYENLCKKIKQSNMRLEMNTSKGPGINSEFLKIALREGVNFSTGSDAHRYEDVGRGIDEVTRLINRRTGSEGL